MMQYVKLMKLSENQLGNFDNNFVNQFCYGCISKLKSFFSLLFVAGC